MVRITGVFLTVPLSKREKKDYFERDSFYGENYWRVPDGPAVKEETKPSLKWFRFLVRITGVFLTIPLSKRKTKPSLKAYVF